MNYPAPNVLDQHLMACGISRNQWPIWYSLLPVIAEPDIPAFEKQKIHCLVVGCTRDNQSVQAGIALLQLIHHILSLVQQQSQKSRLQLHWHHQVPNHDPDPQPFSGVTLTVPPDPIPFSIHFCATQDIRQLTSWLPTLCTTPSIAFVLLQANTDNQWMMPPIIPFTLYHLFLPSPLRHPPIPRPYEPCDKTLEHFVTKHVCVKGG